MLDLIIKKFVSDYENVTDSKVRSQYAFVASCLSIILNVLLCIIKLIAGTLTASVAIQADALNNLSDAGSNLATLLGFQLANQKPDSQHPYGHGRYEYIMGMVIAFLIIVVAFTTFKESIDKLIHPITPIFSSIAIGILIVSLFIKVWMASINFDIGHKIDSVSLIGAGKDSLNDCISTTTTLIALLLSTIIDFPFDGVMGLIVSVFILKSGIDVFNDTVNPLLGQAPDPKFVAEIEEYVLGYPRVIGVHDLIVHNYGPARVFVTLHAEVRSDEDILEAHDMIDEIERNISDKFNCLTTIHMDPIDVSDQKTNQLRELVSNIVTEINSAYSIHDFRLVSGPTHTNLIFDIVLPVQDQGKEKEVKQKIYKKIKEINNNYYAVIEIDYSY